MLCNLGEVHLNNLNPFDLDEQRDAFRAAGLIVAALLQRSFTDERYAIARDLDPIVAVSFTGLFDFFVNAFGVDWLRWWEEGRPNTIAGMKFKMQEQKCLSYWKAIVADTVNEYCDRHGLKRPNRCTALQPAGCLTKESLRVFDQGLLYADEHMSEAQGEVDLSLFGLTVRNGINAGKGIANNLTPLVKITLDNGRWIKATLNHRFSIDGEWVFAEDIKAGTEIDFSLGEYTSENEAKLVPHEYTYSGVGRPPNESLIPNQMSPELAYWIGAMYGNGSTEPKKSRVVFTHGSKNILDRLSEIGTKLFGLTPVRKAGSRKGNFEHLIFSSSHLYSWLQKNGLLKTEKSIHINRIPLAIRSSSKMSILAFIAGFIDADGCISPRSDVEISSASEDFLRNLQQVSEAVGLCWTLSSREQKGSWSGSNIWRLSLRRSCSLPEAINALNIFSVKAESSPIALSSRNSSSNPFKVSSVELIEPEYTYDYGIEGIDDDDSWYWQGGIKSHNTKSLLTGASAGWAPPKAQRFIRRITFRKNDPVALACRDYGYSIVPSQSDKDENGNLLNDPLDPRCTEWLVEIPVEVPWANLPGADTIAIERFSAIAQFDFYMQVQKYYAGHNVSATLELTEDEIEPLGARIYQAIQNNEGYISAALLARFNSPFPRLPFEKIDKETYDRLSQEVLDRRISDDFHALFEKHNTAKHESEGAAPCDSDKCLMPERK